MARAFAIRAATVQDAPALLAIYRPYVENTPVSFEIEPPDVAAYAARIQKTLAGWQWLVAERDGEVLGFVYGSMHRDRPAYRWSVEVTAYVKPGSQRSGIGRALYQQLFQDLAAKGYCNAFAGVTLPNDASVGLHRAVGFEPIGVFRSIGYKFGKWHDVAWFQRQLRDGPPPEPDVNPRTP
jgi:L-amino acid N-acyltransferase YncA